eukprot:401394_1
MAQQAQSPQAELPTRKYCPVRTRQLIIYQHQQNPIRWDAHTLAKRHSLHYKTIQRYFNHYEETGTVLTEYELKKKASKNGKVEREKLFDDPILSEYALDLCVIDPTKPLELYVDDIYMQFGIFVSKDTVDRMFKDRHWTWKKISRVALELDITEEALFWQYVKALVTKPEQMMFLDESNRSDLTPNPTHGRGKGRVYVKISFTRGGYKFALLLVACCNGILVYRVYFGSVNEEIFNKFIIDELAPFLRPYPMECSILFLDNIRFHRNLLFIHFILEMGAMLVFLPHYDPLLNLAETSFRDVKRIEVKKRIYGEIEGFQSLVASVERVKHKNYRGVLRQMGYI